MRIPVLVIGASAGLAAVGAAGCMSPSCACYTVEGEPPRYASNRIEWKLTACGDKQCAAGVTALNHEQWPAAVDAFDAVLEREPGHGHALAGLGYALQMLGRNDEAAERYGQAYEVSRNPEYLRAQQGIRPTARADSTNRSSENG